MLIMLSPVLERPSCAAPQSLSYNLLYRLLSRVSWGRIGKGRRAVALQLALR
jgi:hypothetical protein